MRLFCALLIWLLTLPALAQPAGTVGGFPYLGPYFGQVGTRAYLNDGVTSYTGNVMERGYFYTRAPVSTLTLGFTNYYVDSGGTEQNPGNTYTIKASIEYPPGTCTAMTFSSSSTGTATDGDALLLTDALPISIPTNTKVYWRAFQTVAGNFIYRGADADTAALKDVTNGDATVMTGSTDQTTSCTTVTDSSSGTAMFWPALILDNTTLASVLLIGDSRMIGIRDSYSDGAGYIGDAERSVGPFFGELNTGRSSTTAQEFISSHSKRASLFPYFSTIINELGINDLQFGATGSATEGYVETIAGYFTGPVFQTTLEPWSTTSDACVTTGNQTTISWNGQRNTFNTAVRGVLPGFAGYFDLASAVETSTGSGIWLAPNYAASNDGGGTICGHESQSGNLSVVSAGVINSNSIHR